MGNVLDEETLNIWNGFDEFSQKYYNLLKDRKKAILDTRDL